MPSAFALRTPVVRLAGSTGIVSPHPRLRACESLEMLEEAAPEICEAPTNSAGPISPKGIARLNGFIVSKVSIWLRNYSAVLCDVRFWPTADVRNGSVYGVVALRASRMLVMCSKHRRSSGKLFYFVANFFILWRTFLSRHTSALRARLN
jgi:hypothetical protein